MTNTRVNPVKRVITFILALLMIFSSIVYLGLDAESVLSDIIVYNQNNWKGYYNTYFYATGLYLNGLDYNIAYNPFGVSNEGYLLSTATLHQSGMENAIVAVSTGSTYPSGYKMCLNINSSGNGTYLAVDGNNIASQFDEALAMYSINYGCFSIAALESSTPDPNCFLNHTNYRPISHGLSSNSGLVVNFHNTEMSYLEYTYAFVYYDGALKHMLKLSDRGITVKCNGKSGITMELRRTGNDEYDIYITGSGASEAKYLCSLSDCIKDDTQYYYAVGSFPSGMGNLSANPDGSINHGGAKTDGSFTITSVSSCYGPSSPTTFSGEHGHNFAWHSENNMPYSLYMCGNTEQCGVVSKKRITVTYDANGGTLTGSNTHNHQMNTTQAGAGVKFTPASDIRPTKYAHDFLGWSTDKNATTAMSSITSAVNTTIYAVYAKSTYKLTFDPLGGTFEDGTTANKVYDIHYEDIYQDVIGDMPNPTKRGSVFKGWEVNQSIYSAPDWKPEQAYLVVGDSTFTAKWENMQGYNLTFDLGASDATMPSSFSMNYIFYPGEKLVDIIGGFPVPKRPLYKFTGWKRSGTSTVWADSWGNQIYNFGNNVSLVAQWEEMPGFVLTLDAGKGKFSDTGEHTEDYTVPPNGKLVDNNVPYSVPVRTGYTFLGWQWNNRTDHYWKNPQVFGEGNGGWGTQPYYWEYNVTFDAVWQLSHVHNVTKLRTESFDIGGGIMREYDKVKCSVCGEELYGFKSLFYSRNSGVFDISSVNSGTKYLNRDVPLSEVFENPAVSSCNTYVLSENPTVTLKLKFDPLIRGVTDSGRSLFLGWTVVEPKPYNSKMSYLPKDGTVTISCHDNYFAYYDAGCDEYLFDATYSDRYTTVGGSLATSFSVLVQENRNYGIALVPTGAYYHDYIDYVPSMKCVDGLKLRATNTWYYYGFAFNLVTIYYDNYKSNKGDIVLLPGTSTGGESAVVGAPEGRMNTYYANNKGSKYVEAHYDPNYRYSGTMYYRYVKNQQGQIIWYPDFTFDPRYDSADDNPLYDPSLGVHPEYLPRHHEDYHSEFDWGEYFKDKPAGTVVIIKDPRMYTTYIGDNDPYKFIRIVAEPHGDVYNSMGMNADGTYNIDDTDPDIRRHEVYIKALHSNVYQGDSYIVYKKNSEGHQLPDYRLARDYTKQYNEYSSRYPLYYVYKSNHHFSDYGVTDYDNRFPTKFDRGTLTDRGFQPIVGKFEPLWAYGDGGWNSFDIVEVEKDGFREEWGGFSQILQYPDPESTLIIHNPLATEDQKMIYQYSAYQQWDNKVAFNANVPASLLNNADVYGGENEAYLYTVSYGQFYMPDANLFTRDRYVLAGWATSAERADQGVIDFECGAKINPNELCNYELKDGTTFSFTNFTEQTDTSTTPATVTTTPPTLYAVWKHTVNFTLEEGEVDDGYVGANPFAKVKYINPMTGSYVTTNFNETKTVKTFSESAVIVTVQGAPAGYVYSYMTLNQNNVPLNADRIITSDIKHSFTIIDDTSMTVQFANAGTGSAFYIDRNNKLLRPSTSSDGKWTHDAWRLYTSRAARNPLGPAESGSVDNNALYFLYNDSVSSSSTTTRMKVTVSGSTYDSMNGEYTVPYDDVITLMTGPEDADGNSFVGWKIGDAFVSFDLVYKHRVTGAVKTVTAAYSGERAPSISIVYLPAAGTLENSKDVVVAQRAAPEGYKLIETGFILSRSDKTVTMGELYDANGDYNTAYYKLVSTDTDKDGSFKALLKSSTYYGIAYAYYYDANDNVVLCVTPQFTK